MIWCSSNIDGLQRPVVNRTAVAGRLLTVLLLLPWGSPAALAAEQRQNEAPNSGAAAASVRMPDGYAAFIGQLQGMVAHQDTAGLKALVANPAIFAPSFDAAPVASFDQWMLHTPNAFAVLGKALAFGCAPALMDSAAGAPLMFECPGYGNGEEQGLGTMGNAMSSAEIDPAEQVLLVDGPVAPGGRAAVTGWRTVDNKALAQMDDAQRAAMDTLGGQVPVLDNGQALLLPSNRVVLPLGYRVMVQKAPVKGWALRSVVNGD